MAKGKGFVPQQAPAPGLPGVRPPKGWVPPLGATLTLLGVYDNETGYWQGLPLQALTEALIQAEKLHALDRIDARNGRVSVTVPIGTAVDSSVKGELEVPDGEVWLLNCHESRIHQQAALTAGGLKVDFLVSSFPKTEAGGDKAYDGPDACLSASQAEIAAGDVTDRKRVLIGEYQSISKVDQTTGDVTSTIAQVYREEKRDFRDCQELCTELRLVGPAKLTLVATVQNNAVAGGAITVDLTVWGVRGKRLVS